MASLMTRGRFDLCISSRVNMESEWDQLGVAKGLTSLGVVVIDHTLSEFLYLRVTQYCHPFLWASNFPICSIIFIRVHDT